MAMGDQVLVFVEENHRAADHIIPLHKQNSNTKSLEEDHQQVLQHHLQIGKVTIEQINVSKDDQEAWLPVTESRNGNTYSVTFHILCSGFGMQALLLPAAFATLGWLGHGYHMLVPSICVAALTIWLLTRLHESLPGIRYSRYLHLSIAAFGTKLGKLLALFPTMDLSGGTCVMLIITGGGTMELLFKTVCDSGSMCHAKSLSGAEWFLVFTCMAILMAKLPNLNSMAPVSLIGAITAILYSSLIWVLSITKGRSAGGLSYSPSETVTMNYNMMGKIGSILNALGIIALAFRGHNVILEIQGTLPSSPKHPSHKPMCKGVTISYILIAMCQFPLAIAGFWAYGNKIPYNGLGLLPAFSQFHGHNTSKFTMGFIYLLLLVNCLCAHSKSTQCQFLTTWSSGTRPRRNNSVGGGFGRGIRLFFGGLAFFVAVAFPFLGSLGPLIGGIALPLTLAYPCFMWLSMKKPRSKSVVMWCVSLGLGCLGIVFSVLLVVAAAWTLSYKGLNANFFERP